MFRINIIVFKSYDFTEIQLNDELLTNVTGENEI